MLRILAHPTNELVFKKKKETLSDLNLKKPNPKH